MCYKNLGLLLLLCIALWDTATADDLRQLQADASDSLQKSIRQLHSSLKAKPGPARRADLCQQLARYYSKDQPRPDSARHYALQAYTLVKYPRTQAEERLCLRALQVLVNYYNLKDSTKQVLKTCLEARTRISNSTHKSSFVPEWISFNKDISRVYLRQQNYVQGIRTLQEIPPFVAAHAPTDYPMDSKVYFNISVLFSNLDQPDSAYYYYTVGEQLAQKQGKEKILLKKTSLKARILIQLGKTDEATQLLESLEKQLPAIKNSLTSVNTYTALAALASTRRDSLKELYYSRLAYAAALETNEEQLQAQTGIDLAINLANAGLYEEAYLLHAHSAELILSLINSDTKNQVQALELEHRNELLAREQAASDLQAQALYQQQQNLWLLSALLIAAILLAIVFYKGQQRKKRLSNVLSAQKAQLQELDEAKSRLFANISHELRTPLTLISSPLEQLLLTAQPMPAAALQESLRSMLQQCRQLNALVDDILDLSKVEANKLEVSRHKVDAEVFLARIVAGFDTLARHQGINLRYDLSALTSCWLSLDSPKLEKILNNLISNAIKYTPAGKEVYCEAAYKASNLSIVVADTGQGIASEDLPYIFDRYYQGKRANNPLLGGTGIGLAFARELALLLEGQLVVNSQPGEGATFTVSIPCEEVAAPGKPQAPDELLPEPVCLAHLNPEHRAGSQKEYRVLVVEDHPVMQDFVTGLLGSQYHVTRAANGQEALSRLQEQTIDLIVTDVMMPGLDGFGLLETIKANTAWQHIPMVMLTALGSKEYKLKAIQLGVDDYLIKPFSPQELLARSHNLLSRYATRKAMTEAGSTEEEVISPGGAHAGGNVQVLGKPAITDQDKCLLAQVAELISQELENPDFHLSQLAEELNFSERQLRRKITQLTGLTPKKFQQEIALQHARELLESGAYGNVTAIAYSVGMSHVTRFSQLYEARFGKHPSTYFD